MHAFDTNQQRLDCLYHLYHCRQEHHSSLETVLTAFVDDLARCWPPASTTMVRLTFKGNEFHSKGDGPADDVLQLKLPLQHDLAGTLEVAIAAKSTKPLAPRFPSADQQFLQYVVHQLSALILAKKSAAVTPSDRIRPTPLPEEVHRLTLALAHDLRAPLRAIRGYLALIKPSLQGLGGMEHTRSWVSHATDSAERMEEMLTLALQYLKLGYQPLPMTLADCNQALQKALVNLGPQINVLKAQIRHNPLPLVTGDESQLVTLFQNLIENAIKFHHQDPPKVLVGAAQLGDEWRFAVQDNGIGLAAQDTERVFQLFQRLHTSPVPIDPCWPATPR